ncbi:family 35 putative glycoside hydrolase [Cercophora samala]|uniref:Beta-galactosidase n=1 Tax=Cercophora samala TaxID=330535 RepID=A0AA39ZHZ6_9PEZI|nr:family 35 putative glycoside hydrolase [Cercophora samala]
MAKITSIIAMLLALALITPALATIHYVMPNYTWQLNHTINSGPGWALPLPKLPARNSTSNSTANPFTNSTSHFNTSSPFSYYTYNQDRIKTPPDGWQGPAVTFDNYSLSVYGERIMLYSGEFHYFRLPRSHELWCDVLAKIKALGFNAISTYVPWMLLEPRRGEWDEVGWFDLTMFLEFAQMAGLYVIIRPGPYINAEVSGGGLPGWLQRTTPILRTADLEFLQAAENYVVRVADLIAKWQVDSGGPVILYQVENEYTMSTDSYKGFPDNGYMQWLIEKAKNASIAVPIINNDAWPAGYSRPGIGVGEVDIYGHDLYPFGLDCSKQDWPENATYTDLWEKHTSMSPGTPYTIPEFQGGAFDSWGSVGYDQCVKLFDDVQARVLFKNNYASGVKILNVYMIFGGTNWGNLGHPYVYTSYDYGAAIAEDRTVGRPKYSELKLQANFFKVSPGYLTAMPNENFTDGIVGFQINSTDNQLVATQMTGDSGTFYVIRHRDYRQTDDVAFTLKLPTAPGAWHLPALSSNFVLSGRDSKLLVTDYPFGRFVLTYCSAEILTWNSYNKTTLVLYGNIGEYHELRFTHEWEDPILECSGASLFAGNGTTVAQWTIGPDRQWAVVNNYVYIYLENRRSAYQYWTVDLTPAFSEGASSIIVYGGYLIRSAAETWLEGRTTTSLNVMADFNQTTTLEIMNVPLLARTLTVNSKPVNFTVNDHGNWVVTIDYEYANNTGTPDLVSGIEWNYRDSLPELQSNYDDSGWLRSVLTTNNTDNDPVLTPTSLYGSDYGFHTGVLVFRGHFRATRVKAALNMVTRGGSGYAVSVWLNDQFLYSDIGSVGTDGNQKLYYLPDLEVNYDNLVNYTLTVLVDNMGLEENLYVGRNLMKSPRGIMNYGIFDENVQATVMEVDWKLTGNWKGEYYADQVRGPLNEGGFFAERMGYHLPGAPLSGDTSKNPFKDGLDKPGVGFWSAKLTINWDVFYDTPLSFKFLEADDYKTITNGCRALLYVNGYQFGRYIPHLGPQKEFHVPDGIIYTNGTENHIAIIMWAPNEGGAKLPWLSLKSGHPVRSVRIWPGQMNSFVAESYYDGREGSY